MSYFSIRYDIIAKRSLYYTEVKITRLFSHWLMSMSTFTRLACIRKSKSLTQQALVDAIGLHVTQIKRYEAGTSQLSLEAIKKIAQTLRPTTDSLIFDEGELAPDADLVLQFQAISGMAPERQQVIKQLLEGMIIKKG